MLCQSPFMFILRFHYLSEHSLRIATALRRLMWLRFSFITEERRGEHISFVLLSEPWGWSCYCIACETAFQLPSVVMTLVIYSYILTRQFIVRFLYTVQSLATFFILDISFVRWPIFPGVVLFIAVTVWWLCWLSAVTEKRVDVDIDLKICDASVCDGGINVRVTWLVFWLFLFSYRGKCGGNLVTYKITVGIHEGQICIYVLN